MSNALPLILAGGAAILLLGGGKKASSKTGRKSDIEPSRPPIIDESALETDDDPDGEEAGDFETKEENISLGEGEEYGHVTLQAAAITDPVTKCDEFLRAIHVATVDAGEVPINKVAVEQTVLPVMKETMLEIRQNLGGDLVDVDSVGPVLVLSALGELVPVCSWGYDDENYEFTFNNGEMVESEVGRDVIYGLMQLSVQLIEGFNSDQKDDIPAQEIQEG